jgi:hypothetical protein
MPATLSTLTAKTAEARVFIDGEEAIWFRYRPRSYTAKLEQDIQQAIRDQTPGVSLARAVSQLVVEWDLREVESGPVLGLDFEALLVVPTEILVMVLQAISEEQNPNPTTAAR